MSIRSATVRLQSKSLSVADLVAAGGCAASWSTERGAPVSSRRPDGPTHSVSTVCFAELVDQQDLGECVDAFNDVLERVANRKAEFLDLSADLVVMVTARPMGYMVCLDVRHLQALATAGCGLVLDVYSADDDEDPAPSRPSS